MADSPAFERASEEVERCTSLDRLEARGTIRLLLKEAGLDAKRVRSLELRKVAEKLLARELENRGVADSATAVASVVAALVSVTDSETSESPEDVFARLGGRS